MLVFGLCLSQSASSNETLCFPSSQGVVCGSKKTTTSLQVLLMSFTSFLARRTSNYCENPLESLKVNYFTGKRLMKNFKRHINALLLPTIRTCLTSGNPGRANNCPNALKRLSVVLLGRRDAINLQKTF